MDQPYDTVLELFEDGQMISAWEAGKCAGALDEWPAPGPSILASRLAYQLGNIRLSYLIQIRTYRAYPDDPEAQYYFVSHTHNRRGALAAWEERMAIGPPHSDEAKPNSLFHGQCALLLADLRDFEAAEDHLRRSGQTQPDRPWHCIERAYVFDRKDRTEDALAAAREGMEINPNYQPAISSTAHYLLSQGRSEEAIDLLETKCVETQSSLLVFHLMSVYVDADRMDDAEALIPRYEQLTPLRGKDADEWITNKRISLARHRSDYDLVLQLAETIEHGFFKNVTESIRAFADSEKDDSVLSVRLAVPHVRQHHVTCAPATLTAISKYWDMAVEHLTVAEEICFDGTPMHSERKWAKQNGYHVREFRVDWDSTVALIDRGIPFTLAISDAVYGHLQAVVGYDKPMGIVFIRDPQTQSLIEANARELFEAYESNGPRGMAMVPEDRSQLLAEVELPESTLYDLYHAMQLDLERHEREAAIAHLRRMEDLDRSHRLTWTARGALGSYDDDPPAILEALDVLHERYPKDPALRLYRLHILRQLNSREYRLSWLHGIIEQGIADPVLLTEYATELSADDRERDEAMWYLRRALRRRPDDAPVVHAMAELLWAAGQRERAISYYRFAACVSDTQEHYSRSYFTACRSVGRTDMALDFLRKRVELFGSRSGLPAMSLFGALELLERIEEAFAVLDDARELRPEDGVLVLFAIRKRAQYGYAADAGRLLEGARGKVRETEWLAAAAEQASWHGDRAEALRLWQLVVAVEPLSLEAHRMIAVILSESQSREEALAHLRSVCDKFEHHAGLHRLLYAWTEGDPAVERETVLRHMAAIDPADAWAQRELAANLSRQSRFEEAAQVADEALALDARTAAGFTIKGEILESLGKVDEATEYYRTAIRSWADAPGAIHGLLHTCGDSPEKRTEVLQFVESELLKQAVVGDGFLSYQEVARAVLTPTELLDSLQHAHRKRPDLWQVWSVLALHQAEMGQLDDALAVALEATQRFPRLPVAWIDLSRVHQMRLEPDKQIEALTHCRELNPDWSTPTLALSMALEHQGKRSEAVSVLESAIARTPLEVSLRGQLAQLHYGSGDVDRAIEVATEAVHINPEFEQGWRQLAFWCSQRGESQGPFDMLRRLVEERPGEYSPWIQLAEFQAEAGEFETALDSVERAIAINPRGATGYEFKAYLLTQLRRFREAALACSPEVLGNSPPCYLQGRAAWIDAQRGDYEAAIDRMKRLVRSNPDYQWGWSQLMEWYAETGNQKQAMEAAERLAWLDPTNMVPQGWLGDMKRKLRDVEGAKRVLRRAMEFQPSYLFAGFEYFDIQRCEGDFEGAERTLEILSVHATEGDILAARIQLEVRRNDRDRAFDLMRQLCMMPTADYNALKRAAAAITERHWQGEFQKLLRGILRQEGWHPAVPEVWAGSWADEGFFGTPLRYRYLVSLGEPGKLAVCRVLDALGIEGQRVLRQDRPGRYHWLRWHLRVIRWVCNIWREDDMYWGAVGFALVTLSRYRSMIRWMSDWPSRTNIQPWMLHNLTLALLTKRKDTQARDVLRFVARDLIHTQPVEPRLKLWCVLGATLDEDWELAQQMLHEVPPGALKERQKQLREFADTALQALMAPSREPLSLEAEATFLRVAQTFSHDQVPLRLLNLVRHKVGKHTKRNWIAFEAWAWLYPERITALVAAGAAALILFWIVTGSG